MNAAACVWKQAGGLLVPHFGRRVLARSTYVFESGLDREAPRSPATLFCRDGRLLRCETNFKLGMNARRSAQKGVRDNAGSRMVHRYGRCATMEPELSMLSPTQLQSSHLHLQRVTLCGMALGEKPRPIGYAGGMDRGLYPYEPDVGAL